jgi:hypothetical protein
MIARSSPNAALIMLNMRSNVSGVEPARYVPVAVAVICQTKFQCSQIISSAGGSYLRLMR